MKKVILISSLLIILLSSLLVRPSTSKADGMMMPPYNYYLRETGQKAVIVHERGIETMVLLTQFQGNAKDFAWIVPTPNKPKVDESTDTLFTAIQKLTQPDYSRPYPMLDAAVKSTELGSLAKPTVAVLETKRVGIFDIQVLASNNSEALANWLSDHKYQYPKTQAFILDSYIENGWYFTAIKVNANLASELSISKKLSTGHATPLKFSFKTEKIVFPLKISSVVSETIKAIDFDRPIPQNSGEISSQIYPYYNDQVAINIYVLSNHKVKHANFTADYARWVKRSEIENLAQNSQGDPWQEIKSSRLYLTKLYASMTPSEMTQDVYFTNADDNTPIGVDYALWWMIALIFILTLIITVLSPLGFLFIIFAFVYHFAKGVIWKTVAAIMEVISMILVALVVAAALLWISGQYNAPMAEYLWTVALGVIIVLALMLVWRIFESRRKFVNN